MLTLNSRHVELRGLQQDRRSTVLRVRQGGPEPVLLQANEALLVGPGTTIGPDQTALVLERDAAGVGNVTKRIVLPNEFDYLRDGDVLSVELQRPAVRVLHRRTSLHN